ncbi:uncharacterized protein [Branchiostoma lanceolatum]|uniref:uncharacterized protein n=1 Tax=Branchiostoma lanceolatum TaxID=7740 RepID=UPI003451A758
METNRDEEDGDGGTPGSKRPRLAVPRSSPGVGRARKSLPFTSPVKSPSQRAAYNLIQKARKILSPRQTRSKSVKVTSPKDLLSRRTKKIGWTTSETRALIQYVGMPSEDWNPDRSTSDWPQLSADHTYWKGAAEYVKKTSGADILRSATSVRTKVVNHLRPSYPKLSGGRSAAEKAFGLHLDNCLTSTPQHYNPLSSPLPTIPSSPTLDQSVSMLTGPSQSPTDSSNPRTLSFLPSPVQHPNPLTPNDVLQADLSVLPPESRVTIALRALQSLSVTHQQSFLSDLFDSWSNDTANILTDHLYFKLALSKQITTYPTDFASLSTDAMIRLQTMGKPNSMYKFAQCIARNRPGSQEPLMPLTRMPFGLIQYQIDFYTCTNVQQIKMSDDFRRFQDMMEIELGQRFNRLFRGPGWSGCPRDVWKNPLEARMNVACVSHKTVQHDVAKSGSTATTDIQESALKDLKTANPKGRFWIKLDGTDLKPALQESTKGKWNGDPEINCQVQELRSEYDRRVSVVAKLSTNQNRSLFEQQLTSIVDDLDKDKEWLQDFLTKTINVYRKKSETPNTSEETLKGLNWEIVEISNFIQQSQQLKDIYEDLLRLITPDNPDTRTVTTRHKTQEADTRRYLTGLFKKKRQPAATHVLVIMLSDEERKRKPYALPVQFIPYHSLRDQWIRDLTRKLKERMAFHGLTVVDDEKCELCGGT